MVGDDDLLTPVAHSEEIVRRLPGAEHVVVRHSGHLLMLEHPEVVTMHLVELVERAERSAAPRFEERRRVTRLTPYGDTDAPKGPAARRCSMRAAREAARSEERL